MSFYRMAVYKTYAPRIYPTWFQRNSHPSVCASMLYKKKPSCLGRRAYAEKFLGVLMSFNRNCSATRLCFNECKVGAYAFTRLRYEPSRVSTSTTSPSLMNKGTRISTPVSSLAGFVVLVAVSPFKPGSV